MKRTLLMIVVLLMAASVLLAQKKVVVEKVGAEKNITITMDDLEDLEDLEGLEELENIKINIKKGSSEDSDAPDAAYFGIFVEDITFPKAQALNYKDNYGIIITGVAKGSPAWDYRLLEDDIIMSINEDKILHNKEFDKVRGKLRAGDTIKLGIFRSGSTMEVEMVLGSREKRNTTLTVGGKPEKKKLSAGYGGGTWIPMLVQLDMSEVNELLKRMGFYEQPDNGVFMTGGGGKGPVGKGYFIGGYVVGGDDSQEKSIKDPADPTITLGTKWLRYTNAMGGVTFDKRIPITKNIITSLGVMLGGAEHSIEITKTNGDYDWNDLGNDTDFTNYALKKRYIVAQPRAELMVRLLSWLALRAEVGYTYGYAPSKGWKISGLSGDEFNVVDSPNTEFQGMNFSVGPWFGF